MRLRDIGEFGLIERIARAAGAGEGTGRAPVLGIGDDAALVRPRPGEDVAISTDALVEDVHFRLSNEATTTLGRRAMTAALSDLAAMGAQPLGVTVALEAPPSLELRQVDGLVRGLVRGARRHGCPILGGNLARADRVSLTLTALGAVRRGRALTRAAARPGHRLFVTGTLGASALARTRAERGRGPLRRVPEPRLAAGRALARMRGRGACIDISDGLLADLRHLLEASGAGAELDLARLPRPRGFERACRALGVDPQRLALEGGEDYELLFTRPAGRETPASLTRRLGVAVAEIGRITPEPGIRGVRSGIGGWRHF